MAPRNCQQNGRSITVNDRMQRDYRYDFVEPVGRDFDPFKPDLTPAEMLRLGVFGGKYMNDCANEFPASSFKHAKLTSGSAITHSTTSASKPVSRSANSAGRDGYVRTVRVAVSMVLPLLHGATNARRRQSSDQTLEGNPPSRPSTSACVPARRSVVSQAAAPSAPALGLRQPKTVKRSSGPKETFAKTS